MGGVAFSTKYRQVHNYICTVVRTPPIIYFTPSFVLIQLRIQKCYDESTEQYKMVRSSHGYFHIAIAIWMVLHAWAQCRVWAGLQFDLQNYAYSYIYTRACTCDLGYTMQATVQHSIHLLGIKKYFSLHIIQFYYRL